ncbi:MarR family transcriptional regulator [Burkholderia sp. Ac-20353]|uniref:MarR family winged helix-turn-helix transcriptional regulator n=1 Tax=Burkholderia sp. Ac-20353 TaxID=2703894 RepID=UPI00197B70ED|nr:MarR family transcriptional regulator [Burkholderia sp. Ac-20353]MBN3787944.1 MarR family transcriptional regulator [Burkholderia sp. Ac-20353]
MDYRVNEDLDRSQKLVVALGKARNQAASELDATLKDIGINAQQLGILLTLTRDSATSAAALSKLLGVDPSRMTRVLDGLERSGLVQRSRNSADRRVVNVSLTQAGWGTVEQSAQAIPAVRPRQLACFTNAEFETLSRLLFKLLAA